MSVKDRLRLLEKQNDLDEDSSQRTRTEEVRPPLPIRPSTTSVPALSALHLNPESERDEVRPPLPARPLVSSTGTLWVGITSQVKKRPPVPPKAKSLSGKISTPARDPEPGDAHRILLVDLEEEGDLEIPEASKRLHLNSFTQPDHSIQLSTDQHDESGQELDLVGSNSSLNRTPSPFKEVTQVFSSARDGTLSVWQKAGAPKAFRTVSDSTQAAFKTIQTEAPKTFQGVADGTQKVFNDVHAGIKKTVGGIPVPSAFAKTGDDISDLTKLNMNQPGICSRCASLPLDACFSNPTDAAEAYIPWSTPLSRVALHAKWCRLCQLLLSVLCRDEHDPLQLPEIRDHIKEEWMRGLPLRDWVAEGYIHKDQYWPFGRSEHRHEGSTQVLGPLAAGLSSVGKVLPTLGLRILIRSAAGRPVLDRKDLHRTRAQSYRNGYEAGMEKFVGKYPFSCIVMITISAHQAETPGLLWVDLIGCGNRPNAEQQVLSHFMMQAVKNGFALSLNPPRPLSYGQVLDADWINMSLGKLWLADCETRHGAKCSEPGWAAAMENPSFLRLVDVEDLSLVIADDPSRCRYVVLSYVWGSAQTTKLQYHNVKELSSHRGLERYIPHLPRTIVDAMDVTKTLGERYLWVDALCILQEKCEESSEQISKMDRVYGGALLTIVAANGDSADAGLHGIRRKHFNTADDSGVPRKISQPLAPLRDDITVIAPFKSQQNVNVSFWNKRAWTFQERLLSRRFLIFADDEMIWHCRSAVAREDMPTDTSGYPHPPLNWLNLKSQYLGISVDSHWKDGSFEVTRHGLTHVVRSGTFSEYAKTIEQYSSRTMSYDSDAVNALAGLLRIFSLCFRSECLFGLPTILLDIALLWRPVEPLGRRSSTNGFPSWSWAGWKGRVAYESLCEIERDESGQTMKIEGIRPLLRYFVLDTHNGTLQPLNGTSRGLPLESETIPAEWEAHPRREDCRSATHTCATPDVFDLHPQIIAELSPKHLIFWTSTADAFRLVHMTPQKIDLAVNSAGELKRLSVFGSGSTQAGSILLDGSGPTQLRPGLHQFILIAEAQNSLLDQEKSGSSYPYYLVMLVETDARTGVASRLGLGRIHKAAWVTSEPSLKLICLG